MTRTLASLALLSLAAACGGGSSSSPIALTDLPHQYAVAECTKLLACCAGVSGAPTEANCEAAVTAQLQSSVASIAADSKITYNGGNAGICLSEVGGDSCQVLEYTLPSSVCNQVFAGTVANGGACQTANECQSGLCAGINGGSGTCTAPAAVGANCNIQQGATIGAVCASGSYENGSGSACVCSALLANGTTCAGPYECSSGYCDTTTQLCAAYPQLSSFPAATCQSIFSSF